MAALDFPDAPTNGQVFDKWTWNGTQWVLTAGNGASGVYDMRSGSVVGTTNAAGDLRIVFTPPFRGAGVFVLAQNGDPTNADWYVMGPWAPTASDFWVRCKTLAGAPLANATIRVTYHATGAW